MLCATRIWQTDLHRAEYLKQCVSRCDSDDPSVIVGGRHLDNTTSTMLRPRRERGTVSSSRLVRPPASGVRVPGACAGSRTSMSTETYTGRSATRAATISITPRTSRSSNSMAEKFCKPRSASAWRTFGEYEEPLIPK